MSATIFRDPQGVPHLRAATVDELAWLQGFECAHSRSWQLEMLRRRLEGKVAELLGVTGVDWDLLSRRAGLSDVTRRAFGAMSQESQAFFAAYSAGVNAAIQEGATAPELQDFGAAPQLWQPWTPVGAFWVQQFLFGTFPYLVRDRFVAHHLGSDKLSLLRSEATSESGSNSFVVTGDRTVSGMPLVAGDPHRGFESPNVYLQVRLACDEFDVAGFTFAGVPGVQHFAHTGHVAWGITNAVADYNHLQAQDPELLDWRTDTIEVADCDPVTVRLAATDHGPVVIDTDTETLSLRSPALTHADLGLDAVLGLLRAKTVADVQAAFSTWVEPVNSVVAADTTGAGAQWVAGRVPPRSDPWSSEWVRVPVQEIEDGGFEVTANHRAHDYYDQIGVDFAPSYRADRITALLEHSPPLDADAALSVLLDDRQPELPLLRAIGRIRGLTPAAQALQAELMSWDRNTATDSVAAAALEDVRDWTVFLLSGQEPWRQLESPHDYGSLLDLWLRAEDLVAVALPALCSGEDPQTREVLARALDEVARAPRRPWGERHRFRAFHELERFALPVRQELPSTPIAGDSNTVRCSGSLPGTDSSARGSVARYVWDLADRDRSLWSVPLGADGRPGHPHQLDQHPGWVAGQASPVISDWAALTIERVVGRS